MFFQTVISDPIKETSSLNKPQIEKVPQTFGIIQRQKEKENTQDNNNETVNLESTEEMISQEKEEKKLKTLWYREKAKNVELSILKFVLFLFLFFISIVFFFYNRLIKIFILIVVIVFISLAVVSFSLSVGALKNANNAITSFKRVNTIRLYLIYSYFYYFYSLYFFIQ